jgi:hypothetical protein
MASVANYAGYTFADNEVNLVSVQRRLRLSPRGKKLIATYTMRCSGELIYSSTDTIITKIQAVENALKQEGDFTYTVGGTLAHSLRNSGDCISGVKVIDYSFPTGDAAQLATTRTFAFTVQASYNVAADNIVSWQESIEVTGTGGPLWVVVNTVAGIQTSGGPLAFFLAPATAQYYHQYGHAIGFSDYPVPTPPINSQIEFGYRRRITNTSGVNQGTQIKFYKTSWSYYMATDPRNGTFTNTPTSK